MGCWTLAPGNGYRRDKVNTVRGELNPFSEVNVQRVGWRGNLVKIK
jgi:hypothetical protein